MLKKITLILAAFIILFFSISGTSSLLLDFYSNKVADQYHPKLGLEATLKKSLSLLLNKNSIKKNYLPIFASCELEDNAPNLVFKNGKSGFFINKIGFGGNQSIIQFLHMASMGNTLKGKKVIILVSPFWFNKRGIVPIFFKLSFSELQFYTYMKNQKLTDDLKIKLCKRILSIPKDSFNQFFITLYSYLYLNQKSTFFSIIFNISKPFYDLKLKILSLKDTFDAYKKLTLLKVSSPISEYSIEKEIIDWNDFKDYCTTLDKKKSNSKLYCKESYYKWRIKKKTIKKWPINMTQDSPEYNDFALLLELCKELEVKPLFISMPVHGFIYDHVAQWYKIDSPTQRQNYYSRIEKMIGLNNFPLLDLRHHEYTPWFSKTHSQIGKTGWAYINEEIYKFYYKK